MTQTLTEIQKEITTELANPQNVKTLLETTFKGLNADVMPIAITEGMLRGFKFIDFLQKNIYAIPYGQGYSLVTSIDWSRKVGAKSGIVGKENPLYSNDPDMGLKCSVTVKKRFPDGYIGDFSAEVFFKEFTTGRNLWSTKPRMMIAKVAEMHALRMACPEELAQSYIEEELERGSKGETAPVIDTIDMAKHEAELRATKTYDELGTVWAALPPTAKVELLKVKNELKKQYENNTVSE